MEGGGEGGRGEDQEELDRRIMPISSIFPAFGSTWRGEDQGELDRRIMPISSIFKNSVCAAVNFSGFRRRARAWTGGPCVSM